METFTVRPSRRGKDFSEELYSRGRYHSFELPDGTVLQGTQTLENLTWRWSEFPLPESLAGKRVLDIGAWDGWFSFEAERRGAQVLAIDCVEIQNFVEMQHYLASKVEYRILDFYELTQSGLGTFDYVFFLGVLYHLKHPLLALEMVCSMTTDTAIVESFVTDGDTWREHASEIPSMEFYETDELGNQLDNWIGPGVQCLMAMCRAAGFARVELMYAKGSQAGAVCYRHWEPVVNAFQKPPEVIAVDNARTHGINFYTRKEEYISCLFRTTHQSVTREELRFEVGGFGVPALFVRHDPDGKWMGNFRLPPGLQPGWHEARLRFADSDFGEPFRVAVDLPVKTEHLKLVGACDGNNWKVEAIEVTDRGYVSSWVQGLPENCDRDNVRVILDTTRLAIDFVGDQDSDGNRQINAVIPGTFGKGEHQLHIECAGVSSESLTIRLV